MRNGRVEGCPVVLVESPFAQHTPPVRFAHLAEAQSYVTYVAAPIARAIESALAEQAAGEAERVREAVAREREACARVVLDAPLVSTPGKGGRCNGIATQRLAAERIRARGDAEKESKE